MKSEYYVELIKFYHTLISTVLLGIGAAVVTIVGFGFTYKVYFYLLIACVLMIISCVLFLYAKKAIVHFWLCIYADTKDQKVLLYINMFLGNLKKKKEDKEKKDKTEKEESNDLKNLYTSNEITSDDAYSINKKLINCLIRPNTFFPVYLGAFPALYWITIILIIMFVVLLMSGDGWTWFSVAS